MFVIRRVNIVCSSGNERKKYQAAKTHDSRRHSLIFLSPDGLLIRHCFVCTRPLMGNWFGLLYLYHLYPWLSGSTVSPATFALGRGGGSAGCTASIFSFSGAISGIKVFSDWVREVIGATTDTVVVKLYSDWIVCGIYGSSTGSDTASIYGWIIDLREAIIATTSEDRGISGIVGGVGTVTGTYWGTTDAALMEQTFNLAIFVVPPLRSYRDQTYQLLFPVSVGLFKDAITSPLTIL